MQLRFDKAFEKDIRKLSDKEVRERLREKIYALKSVDSLNEIAGLKKIKGYTDYYRLRIGDYRLGLEIEGQTLALVRFLHRKEIYKRFP